MSGKARKDREDEGLSEKKDWRLLRRLWPFLRPQLWLMITSLLVSPLLAAMAVIRPMFVQRAIDENLLPKVEQGLLDLCVFFGAFLLVESLLRIGLSYGFNLLGQKAMFEIRRALFLRIFRLRQEYFDKTPAGRTLTRVTTDVEALNEFLSSGFVTVFSDLLLMLVTAIVMFSLDWALSLVAFISLPLTFWGVNWLRRKLRRIFGVERRASAKLNSRLAENLQGMPIIQALGCEDWAQGEFDRCNRFNRQSQVLSVRYSSTLSAYVEAMATLSLALALGYGVFGIERGLTLGGFVLFVNYLQRFFGPVEDLANKFSILQRALASTERIVGLLDDPRTEPVPSESLPIPDKASLVIDQVGFAYGDGKPALQGVSLTIAPGEKIALVGPTGAGKSTLAKLLTRLYEPTEGQILVDGKLLLSLSPRELRRRWLVVPQDAFLFSRSIRENLDLDRGLPPERLEEACQAVRAWDFIQELPRGLDTELGERGTNLSSGERQLLALARILAHDPQMLILDEATAHVDSETESRLQKAVEQVLVGRTAVVIAHRLATVQRCDRIFVLQGGRLVESGNHRELLAQDGLYARLCRLQVLG